jgi:phosphoglycolate phosphatase-like HAD superfamily hydrolase
VVGYTRTTRRAFLAAGGTAAAALAADTREAPAGEDRGLRGAGIAPDHGVIAVPEDAGADPLAALRATVIGTCIRCRTCGRNTDAAWPGRGMIGGVAGSTLLLWDVDRTLVDVGPVSREIYSAAFRLALGRPLVALADTAGRTERAILAETLRLNGLPDGEHTLEVFYRALGEAARGLAERIRQAGARLPGALEAVVGMAAAGAVVQSVVTGNTRDVAAVKLAVFDLAGRLDLDVGGYGDDDGDRAVLVRLARTRAEAKYRRVFPPGRVVVVGDTPHDVRGARDAGARAVGVATGASGAAELAAAGADAVLADLTDAAALHAAVLGAPTVGR